MRITTERRPTALQLSSPARCPVRREQPALLPAACKAAPPDRQTAVHRGVFFVLLLLAAAILPAQYAGAEDNGEDVAGPSAVAPDPGQFAGDGVPQSGEESRMAPAEQVEGMGFFTLLVRGGVLMIPIVLMSLLVVAFAVERYLALRRSRILPGQLVAGLGQMGDSQSFDPRQAYRLCQQYPSAASNVIRAMLLKVGRPHSEVEHTVGEASNREADRLYANVRWLNLAAAVTPLMGLFGTVWGMIRAFHDTTTLLPGQNKADFLAEGIYVALVTTLAGLAVAIPAAILAHYYEGRIRALFHEVDELLFNLLPQIEQYEGRVRFSRNVGEGPPAHEAGTTGEVVAPPPHTAASASHYT